MSKPSQLCGISSSDLVKIFDKYKNKTTEEFVAALVTSFPAKKNDLLVPAFKTIYNIAAISSLTNDEQLKLSFNKINKLLKKAIANSNNKVESSPTIKINPKPAIKPPKAEIITKVVGTEATDPEVTDPDIPLRIETLDEIESILASDKNAIPLDKDEFDKMTYQKYIFGGDAKRFNDFERYVLNTLISIIAPYKKRAVGQRFKASDFHLSEPDIPLKNYLRDLKTNYSDANLVITETPDNVLFPSILAQGNNFQNLVKLITDGGIYLNSDGDFVSNDTPGEGATDMSGDRSVHGFTILTKDAKMFLQSMPFYEIRSVVDERTGQLVNRAVQSTTTPFFNIYFLSNVLDLLKKQGLSDVSLFEFTKNPGIWINKADPFVNNILQSFWINFLEPTETPIYDEAGNFLYYHTSRASQIRELKENQEHKSVASIDLDELLTVMMKLAVKDSVAYIKQRGGTVVLEQPNSARNRFELSIEHQAALNGNSFEFLELNLEDVSNEFSDSKLRLTFKLEEGDASEFSISFERYQTSSGVALLLDQESLDKFNKESFNFKLKLLGLLKLPHKLLTRNFWNAYNASSNNDPFLSFENTIANLAFALALNNEQNRQNIEADTEFFGKFVNNVDKINEDDESDLIEDDLAEQYRPDLKYSIFGYTNLVRDLMFKIVEIEKTLNSAAAKPYTTDVNGNRTATTLNNSIVGKAHSFIKEAKEVSQKGEISILKDNVLVTGLVEILNAQAKRDGRYSRIKGRAEDYKDFESTDHHTQLIKDYFLEHFINSNGTQVLIQPTSNGTRPHSTLINFNFSNILKDIAGKSKSDIILYLKNAFITSQHKKYKYQEKLTKQKYISFFENLLANPIYKEGTDEYNLLQSKAEEINNIIKELRLEKTTLSDLQVLLTILKLPVKFYELSTNLIYKVDYVKSKNFGRLNNGLVELVKLWKLTESNYNEVSDYIDTKYSIFNQQLEHSKFFEVSLSSKKLSALSRVLGTNFSKDAKSVKRDLSHFYFYVHALLSESYLDLVGQNILSYVSDINLSKEDPGSDFNSLKGDIEEVSGQTASDESITRALLDETLEAALKKRVKRVITDTTNVDSLRTEPNSIRHAKKNYKQLTIRERKEIFDLLLNESSADPRDGVVIVHKLTLILEKRGAGNKYSGIERNPNNYAEMGTKKNFSYSYDPITGIGTSQKKATHMPPTAEFGRMATPAFAKYWQIMNSHYEFSQRAKDEFGVNNMYEFWLKEGGYSYNDLDTDIWEVILDKVEDYENSLANDPGLTAQEKEEHSVLNKIIDSMTFTSAEKRGNKGVIDWEDVLSDKLNFLPIVEFRNDIHGLINTKEKNEDTEADIADPAQVGAAISYESSETKELEDEYKHIEASLIKINSKIANLEKLKYLKATVNRVKKITKDEKYELPAKLLKKLNSSNVNTILEGLDDMGKEEYKIGNTKLSTIFSEEFIRQIGIEEVLNQDYVGLSTSLLLKSANRLSLSNKELFQLLTPRFSVRVVSQVSKLRKYGLRYVLIPSFNLYDIYEHPDFAQPVTKVQIELAAEQNQELSDKLYTLDVDEDILNSLPGNVKLRIVTENNNQIETNYIYAAELIYKINNGFLQENQLIDLKLIDYTANGTAVVRQLNFYKYIHRDGTNLETVPEYQRFLELKNEPDSLEKEQELNDLRLILQLRLSEKDQNGEYYWSVLPGEILIKPFGFKSFAVKKGESLSEYITFEKDRNGLDPKEEYKKYRNSLKNGGDLYEGYQRTTEYEKLYEKLYNNTLTQIQDIHVNLLERSLKNNLKEEDLVNILIYGIPFDITQFRAEKTQFSGLLKKILKVSERLAIEHKNTPLGKLFEEKYQILNDFEPSSVNYEEDPDNYNKLLADINIFNEIQKEFEEDLINEIVKNRALNFRSWLSVILPRTPNQALSYTSVGTITEFIWSAQNGIATSSIAMLLAGEDLDIDEKSVLGLRFNEFGQLYDYSPFLENKRLNVSKLEASVEAAASSITNVDAKHEYLISKLQEVSHYLGNRSFDLLYDILLNPGRALETNSRSAEMLVLKKTAAKNNEKLSKVNRVKLAKGEYVPGSSSYLNPGSVVSMDMEFFTGMSAIGVGATGEKVLSAQTYAQRVQIEKGKTVKAIDIIRVSDISDKIEDQLKILKLLREKIFTTTEDYDTINNSISFLVSNPDNSYTYNPVRYFSSNKLYTPEGIKLDNNARKVINKINSLNTLDEKIAVIKQEAEKLGFYKDLVTDKRSWYMLSELISAATDNGNELLLSQLGIDTTINGILTTGLIANLQFDHIMSLLNSDEFLQVYNEVKLGNSDALAITGKYRKTSLFGKIEYLLKKDKILSNIKDKTISILQNQEEIEAKYKSLKTKLNKKYKLGSVEYIFTDKEVNNDNKRPLEGLMASKFISNNSNLTQNEIDVVNTIQQKKSSQYSTKDLNIVLSVISAIKQNKSIIVDSSINSSLKTFITEALKKLNLVDNALIVSINKKKNKIYLHSSVLFSESSSTLLKAEELILGDSLILLENEPTDIFDQFIKIKDQLTTKEDFDITLRAVSDKVYSDYNELKELYANPLFNIYKLLLIKNELNITKPLINLNTLPPSNPLDMLKIQIQFQLFLASLLPDTTKKDEKLIPLKKNLKELEKMEKDEVIDIQLIQDILTKNKVNNLNDLIDLKRFFKDENYRMKFEKYYNDTAILSMSNPITFLENYNSIFLHFENLYNAQVELENLAVVLKLATEYAPDFVQKFNDNRTAKDFINSMHRILVAEYFSTLDSSLSTITLGEYSVDVRTSAGRDEFIHEFTKILKNYIVNSNTNNFLLRNKIQFQEDKGIIKSIGVNREENSPQLPLMINAVASLKNSDNLFERQLHRALYLYNLLLTQNGADFDGFTPLFDLETKQHYQDFCASLETGNEAFINKVRKSINIQKLYALNRNVVYRLPSSVSNKVRDYISLEDEMSGMATYEEIYDSKRENNRVYDPVEIAAYTRAERRLLVKSASGDLYIYDKRVEKIVRVTSLYSYYSIPIDLSKPALLPDGELDLESIGLRRGYPMFYKENNEIKEGLYLCKDDNLDLIIDTGDGNLKKFNELETLLLPENSHIYLEGNEVKYRRIPINEELLNMTVSDFVKDLDDNLNDDVKKAILSKVGNSFVKVNFDENQKVGIISDRVILNGKRVRVEYYGSPNFNTEQELNNFLSSTNLNSAQKTEARLNPEKFHFIKIIPIDTILNVGLKDMIRLPKNFRKDILKGAKILLDRHSINLERFEEGEQKRVIIKNRGKEKIYRLVNEGSYSNVNDFLKNNSLGISTEKELKAYLNKLDSPIVEAFLTGSIEREFTFFSVTPILKEEENQNSIAAYEQLKLIKENIEDIKLSEISISYFGSYIPTELQDYLSKFELGGLFLNNVKVIENGSATLKQPEPITSFKKAALENKFKEFKQKYRDARKDIDEEFKDLIEFNHPYTKEYGDLIQSFENSDELYFISNHRIKTIVTNNGDKILTDTQNPEFDFILNYAITHDIKKDIYQLFKNIQGDYVWTKFDYKTNTFKISHIPVFKSNSMIYTTFNYNSNESINEEYFESVILNTQNFIKRSSNFYQEETISKNFVDEEQVLLPDDQEFHLEYITPQLTEEEVQIRVSKLFKDTKLVSRLDRNVTSKTKKDAENGNLNAQKTWLLEEVSEFYDALRKQDANEIGEELIGLFRIVQQFPGVKLEIAPYLEDLINTLNSSEFDYSKQFELWKAKKTKKNQALDVTENSLLIFINSLIENKQNLINEFLNLKPNYEQLKRKVLDTQELVASDRINVNFVKGDESLITEDRYPGARLRTTFIVETESGKGQESIVNNKNLTIPINSKSIIRFDAIQPDDVVNNTVKILADNSILIRHEKNSRVQYFVHFVNDEQRASYGDFQGIHVLKNKIIKINNKFYEFDNLLEIGDIKQFYRRDTLVLERKQLVQAKKLLRETYERFFLTDVPSDHNTRIKYMSEPSYSRLALMASRKEIPGIKNAELKDIKYTKGVVELISYLKIKFEDLIELNGEVSPLKVNLDNFIDRNTPISYIEYINKKLEIYNLINSRINVITSNLTKKTNKSKPKLNADSSEAVLEPTYDNLKKEFEDKQKTPVYIFAGDDKFTGKGYYTSTIAFKDNVDNKQSLTNRNSNLIKVGKQEVIDETTGLIRSYTIPFHRAYFDKESKTYTWAAKNNRDALYSIYEFFRWYMSNLDALEGRELIFVIGNDENAPLYKVANNIKNFLNSDKNVNEEFSEEENENSFYDEDDESFIATAQGNFLTMGQVAALFGQYLNLNKESSFLSKLLNEKDLYLRNIVVPPKFAEIANKSNYASLATRTNLRFKEQSNIPAGKFITFPQLGINFDLDLVGDISLKEKLASEFGLPIDTPVKKLLSVSKSVNEDNLNVPAGLIFKQVFKQWLLENPTKANQIAVKLSKYTFYNPEMDKKKNNAASAFIEAMNDLYGFEKYLLQEAYEAKNPTNAPILVLSPKELSNIVWDTSSPKIGSQAKVKTNGKIYRGILTKKTISIYDPERGTIDYEFFEKFGINKYGVLDSLQGISSLLQSLKEKDYDTYSKVYNESLGYYPSISILSLSDDIFIEEGSRVNEPGEISNLISISKPINNSHIEAAKHANIFLPLDSRRSLKDIMSSTSTSGTAWLSNYMSGVLSKQKNIILEYDKDDTVLIIGNLIYDNPDSNIAMLESLFEVYKPFLDKIIEAEANIAIPDTDRGVANFIRSYLYANNYTQIDDHLFSKKEPIRKTYLDKLNQITPISVSIRINKETNIDKIGRINDFDTSLYYPESGDDYFKIGQNLGITASEDLTKFNGHNYRITINKDNIVSASEKIRNSSKLNLKDLIYELGLNTKSFNDERGVYRDNQKDEGNKNWRRKVRLDQELEFIKAATYLAYVDNSKDRLKNNFMNSQEEILNQFELLLAQDINFRLFVNKVIYLEDNRIEASDIKKLAMLRSRDVTLKFLSEKLGADKINFSLVNSPQFRLINQPKLDKEKTSDYKNDFFSLHSVTEDELFVIQEGDGTLIELLEYLSLIVPGKIFNSGQVINLKARDSFIKQGTKALQLDNEDYIILDSSVISTLSPNKVNHAIKHNEFIIRNKIIESLLKLKGRSYAYLYNYITNTSRQSLVEEDEHTDTVLRYYDFVTGEVISYYHDSANPAKEPSRLLKDVQFSIAYRQIRNLTNLFRLDDGTVDKEYILDQLNSTVSDSFRQMVNSHMRNMRGYYGDTFENLMKGTPDFKLESNFSNLMSFMTKNGALAKYRDAATGDEFNVRIFYYARTRQYYILKDNGSYFTIQLNDNGKFEKENGTDNLKYLKLRHIDKKNSFPLPDSINLGEVYGIINLVNGDNLEGTFEVIQSTKLDLTNRKRLLTLIDLENNQEYNYDYIGKGWELAEDLTSRISSDNIVFVNPEPEMLTEGQPVSVIRTLYGPLRVNGVAQKGRSGKIDEIATDNDVYTFVRKDKDSYWTYAKRKKGGLSTQTILYKKSNLKNINYATKQLSREASLEILYKLFKNIDVEYEALSTFDIETLYGLSFSNKIAFTFNGKIVFNIDKMTLDTPVHELGHIIMNQLKVNNPKMYQQIIDLTLEQTDIKDEILKGYPEYENDPNGLGEEIFVTMLGYANQDKLLPVHKSIWSRILEILGDIILKLKEIVYQLFGVNKDIDFKINKDSTLKSIIDELGDRIIFKPQSILYSLSKETKKELKESNIFEDEFDPITKLNKNTVFYSTFTRLAEQGYIKRHCVI